MVVFPVGTKTYGYVSYREVAFFLLNKEEVMVLVVEIIHPTANLDRTLAIVVGYCKLVEIKISFLVFLDPY